MSTMSDTATIDRAARALYEALCRVRPVPLPVGCPEARRLRKAAQGASRRYAEQSCRAWGVPGRYLRGVGIY